MNLALLLLRILLALVLWVHASQKLLGWFSGAGHRASAELFHTLGQRPGRLMVIAAAAAEFGGGTLLGLGLATPLGAAVCLGTMLVAGGSLSLLKGSIWSARGGGEYPLFLAATAAVIGFSGAGHWSVDYVAGAPWSTLSEPGAALAGLAVLAIGTAAAIPPLLQSTRIRDTEKQLSSTASR